MTQQADEQEVHAETLEFRFSPAQQRRDIEAGRQPGGRDPQHRELGVPGPGDRIGEIFRHRQAVEALPLDRIMGGDDAEQHLREEHRGDDEEIFGGRAHRRRDRRGAEQVGLGKAFERLDVAPPDVELARIIPDQAADAGEQHEDRDEGPQEDRAGRRVADQRLVRPVAGIADRVAGPLGGGRPGRPEEEGAQRMRLVRGQHGVLRHRVELAQMLVGGRAVGEQVAVMGGGRRDGGGALVADGDDARSADRSRWCAFRA